MFGITVFREQAAMAAAHLVDARRRPTAPGTGRRRVNQVDGNDAVELLYRLGGQSQPRQFRSTFAARISAFRPDLDKQTIGAEVDRHINKHLPQPTWRTSGKTQLKKHAARVTVSLQQAGLIEPESNTIKPNQRILRALQSLDDVFTGKLEMNFIFNKGAVLNRKLTVISDQAQVKVCVQVEDGNIRLGHSKDGKAGVKMSVSGDKNPAGVLKASVGPLDVQVKEADIIINRKGKLDSEAKAKGVKSFLLIALADLIGKKGSKQLALPGGKQENVSVSQFYQAYITSRQDRQIKAAGKPAKISSRFEPQQVTMNIDGSLPASAVEGYLKSQPLMANVNISSTSVSLTPQELLQRSPFEEWHPVIAHWAEQLVSTFGPETLSLGWDENADPEIKANIHRLEGGRIDCDNSRIEFEPPMEMRIGSTALNIESIGFYEAIRNGEAKIFAKLDLGNSTSYTGWAAVDGAINSAINSTVGGMLNFAVSYFHFPQSNSINGDGFMARPPLINNEMDIHLSASAVNLERETVQAVAQDTVLIESLNGHEVNQIKMKISVQTRNPRREPRQES